MGCDYQTMKNGSPIDRSPVSGVVWPPDWPRENRQPMRSRLLLQSIRQYQHHHLQPSIFNRLAARYWYLQYRFWSVITQAEIAITTPLGGGLLIPHPNGIVIHPAVEIGTNCMVFQQVTIGAANKHGVPKIGSHVDIGAGAKILGPITIGDHVIVGANAVVTKDVPSGAIVAGIPARIIGKR
ncbi:MAG: DapH/DapD/GlmU-related protein [Hyphomicrobiales bacterium]